MKPLRSSTLLFLWILTSNSSFAQPCKEVVGYYPGWQWYDRAQLVNPFTIDYSKYTILNYAFFNPNADGTISGLDPWADENILLGQINWSTDPVSHYPNTGLVDRAHNEGIKVLISVGGWTLSTNFPSIASDAIKRE
jgi:chitinase